MHNLYKGRVALVTGAGQGLGEAYAKQLAELGAIVVVNDCAKDLDGLYMAKAVSERINHIGGLSIYNTTSVADYQNIKEMITYIIEEYGRLDILIHNAGKVTNRLLDECEIHEWMECMDVNLNAAFYLIKETCMHMKKNNFGRIVLVSSSAGMYGMKAECAYSASKMGLWGLARSIQKEMNGYNIYCNIISPLAQSKMIEDVLDLEMQKLFSRENVASMVSALCSPDLSDGGKIYQVAGGYISRIELCQSIGKVFKVENNNYEEILKSLNNITDMNGCVTVSSILQAGKIILKKLRTSC